MDLAADRILLVDLREAARRCGLAPETARAWVRVGRFPTPAPGLGRLRRWRVADVERFAADPAAWRREHGDGGDGGAFESRR